MLLRPFGAMNGCCGMSGDRMRRGTAGAPRNAGTEFASGPSGIAVGGTSAVAARARTMTMKTSVQRITDRGTARGARRQFPPCREGDDRRHGTVAHGIAGHAAGAGVLGCATNRPERSVFAVVGGCPVSFAGASAHQTRWPRKSRVAIRPCNGSFSEYAPNPRMVILSAVIVTDRTGPPPTRQLRKAYPLGLVFVPRYLQPR